MAILYETKGRIAYITINRPEVMNAMDPDTYRELSEAWTDVRDNQDVWCAIITGAGDRAFTAGADLRKTIPHRPEQWSFWQTQQEQILNRGLEIWKPVIAAVNGYCLGGGMTLLLATDIRIAAPHAQFGVPEVKRGILPANGGTQRIIRQLPYSIAMWLLLSGERMNAEDALHYGLINKIVPADKLMDNAEQMANLICENGPLAVRAIKELAVRGQFMPIEYGLRLEEAIAKVLRATEDAQEGPKAFAEKRKPIFHGR